MTGFFLSAEDEFLLQAFARVQVFRPDCAILVFVGLMGVKCAIGQIIKGLKLGKLADRLIDWNPEFDWKTPLSEVRKKTGKSTTK